MKRAWRWIGIVLLCMLLYVAFMLVFAPADYAAKALAHYSHGTVTLNQPSGNLWNGNGTLVVTPRGGATTSGHLKWSLSPWPLLVGKAVVTFEYKNEDIDAQGIVHASTRRYAVTDLTLTAPVTVAGKLYPPASILGLSGTMRLTAPTFELTPDGMQGTADILWKGAATRLLALPSVSDYSLVLTGSGKRLDIQVRTLQGELQLSGQGTWRAMEDGMLRFEGVIGTATPQPTLEPLLNSIAPVQADGRRSFARDLWLPPLTPARLFP